VLHPLHCLVSRFHNTHSFDRYQGDRGLLQARAAIGCARAYLTSLCDENDVRPQGRASRSGSGVAQIAASADKGLPGTRSSSASAARSGGCGIAPGYAHPNCFTYARTAYQGAHLVIEKYAELD
jgi:hypothetical protein